jgi:hypothetical protein
MNKIDEQAARQLSALAEVGACLQQAGIASWLFGGWAVDFYVGTVTRVHDDVDLTVWFEDVARIVPLLLEIDWQHAPSDDEDGGTGFERAVVRLELTYLVRDDNGRACIPLRTGAVAWPGEDGLGDVVGELQGVQARLLGRAALLRGKATPRDDPDDAAKDQADFLHLSRRRA